MRWMIGGFLLLFGLTTGEAAPPDHSADAGKMVVAGITAQAERTSFYSPGAPLVIGLAANVTIPGKAVAAGSSLGGVELPDRASSADLGPLVERWRPLVEAFFGPAADEALRVIRCESSGLPWETNGIMLGLFQISDYHPASGWQGWWRYFGFDSSRYAEPAYNVELARRIYDYDLSHGYAPWTQWQCKP